MLSSLAILASASLAVAWPAVLYTDVNCTMPLKVISHLPPGECVNTIGAQSYSGSLGSEKDKLEIYRETDKCFKDLPFEASINGAPQSCIFIYKYIGPFSAAKIGPAYPPGLSLWQQD